MSSTTDQITIVFPAFAKLAEYLIAHEVDAQTAGFLVGKASRDFWTAAAAKAAEELGEDRIKEISGEEDLEKRFSLLRDEYKAKTQIDIQERLTIAAEQIVAEFIKED